MSKPSGSRQPPLQPRSPGPAPARGAIGLLALLTSVGACSSSSTSTFVAPAPSRCAVTATASTTSFPPGGGAGTVEISTARECSWVVQSDAPWIVPQAEARGQGDGSARFTIAVNTDPEGRAAALSVSDARLQISQGGSPCEFDLSSTRETVGVTGGQLTITVDASSPRCRWSTAAEVPWISVVSGASHTGDGAVVIEVAATAGPPRAGTVTVAGQTLTIDQASACTAEPGTTALTIGHSGGRLEVPIFAPPGCAWSARAEESWITIIEGHTGAGNGTVRLDVAAAPGPPRSGTLIVAGRSVRVHQGNGCVVTTGLTTTSVGAAGGAVQVPVLAGVDCPWTARSEVPWISITSGSSGTGPGTVVLSAALTDGPARTGTVDVSGVRVTVTQLSGCRYSVQPASYAAAAAGAASSVTLQTAAGCPWTAGSAVTWISVPQTSGGGATAVPFGVAANNGPARTGTLSVAGSAVTVAQASPCTWRLAPASVDYDADGGRAAVLVIVDGACTWTAVSTVDWITMDSGHAGVGNGLVQFIVAANPGPVRSGVVRIAGIDLQVRQSAR